MGISLQLRMKKILLFALILRLVVALLGEHGDVINYYWWTKDLIDHGLLGFYDRNIANAMRPTYPPVTTYLFFLTGILHQLVWKVSWILNQTFPIFPSNFIFWLESIKGWYFFNKLPAIAADLGLTYLLFKFGESLKNKKAGIFSAAAFAFLPPFWYNSALWGQTDSVYALPLLASLYFLHKKHLVFSAFLFVLSLLTKPNAVFVLPIYFIWWIKMSDFKKTLTSLFVVCVEILLLYLPFHPQNLIIWIAEFYQRSLGGELSYIVANAFNLWALLFGFDNRPDTTTLFGAPVYLIGNALFFASAALCMWITWKRKVNTPTLILLGAILSFCAFLFLPRMHERYFYPALLLLTLSAGVDPKLRKLFIALSTIHTINMYHFWWVPQIGLFIVLLSDHLVEKALIISNMVLFVFLVREFRRRYLA